MSLFRGFGKQKGREGRNSSASLSSPSSSSPSSSSSVFSSPVGSGANTAKIASAPRPTSFNFSVAKLRRKSSSSEPSENEILEREYEERKQTMKQLIALYEDLVKNYQAIKTTLSSFTTDSKELTTMLSRIFSSFETPQSFPSHIDPPPYHQFLLQSPQLLRDVCAMRNEIIAFRETTLITLADQQRNSAEIFIQKTITPSKRATDETLKAIAQFETALNSLQTHLQSVTKSTARAAAAAAGSSSSSSSSWVGNDEYTINAPAIDQTSLLQMQANTHSTFHKKQTKSNLSNLLFFETMLQKDIEVINQIESWYNAEVELFSRASEKYGQLNASKELGKMERQCEEWLTLAKTRYTTACVEEARSSDFTHFVSILQFLIDGGIEALLVVANQTGGLPEEHKIIECVCLSMDCYNLFLPFMYQAISEEVGNTTSQTTLLRGNTYLSKTLLAYLRVKCLRYLMPLKPLIEEAISLADSLEVDPQKSKGEDVGQAMDRLVELSRRFLDVIAEAIEDMPLVLKQIMQHLCMETESKFEGKGKNFAGSFIFLRFVCPSFVFPEQNGLRDQKDELTKEQRRGLMLVSKVLQNAANGIEFREPYMLRLNEEFLTPNRPFIIHLFDKITQPTPKTEADDKLAEIDSVNNNELKYMCDFMLQQMEPMTRQLETRARHLIPVFAQSLAQISLHLYPLS